jgi:hypothetical protein
MRFADVGIRSRAGRARWRSAPGNRSPGNVASAIHLDTIRLAGMDGAGCAGSRIAVLATLVVMAWMGRPASACSFPANVPHVRDPMHANDAVAPGEVTATFVSVSPPADTEGCGAQSGNSCSGLGSFSFVLEASDDQTPADSMGFQLRLVEGELPNLLGGFPSEPQRPYQPGASFVFVFSDHEPQAISFVLEVRAVDLNGNLGPPLRIQILRAAESGACAATMPLRGAPWIVAVLFVISWRPRRADAARRDR